MPYMKNGKRDYATEYRKYHAKKSEKTKRAARNKAHREMEKRTGRNIKGDVDHIKPLSKGGSNSPSNWRVRSPSANRSFRRNADGSIKS